ncbi:hypothetical protein GGS26DRAFT_359614 [Hypomontagnella submonticulosa]|nr:hypothetical protein GGS26DRAFT_359614 [Hypomontagnella submonticulosa]
MGFIRNTPDDTATDGPMIVAVSSILTGLSLVFICLRIYVRGHLIHKLGIDDWTIFITWILSCSLTIVVAIQTTWGLGIKNIGDIPDQNITPFGILEYASSPLYILAVLGFKLSLLVSYFRFVPQGMCKYGVTCVLVTCTVFHLACLIVHLLLCQPVAAQWDPRITGKCVNILSYYTSEAALTIVFDFAVMFLPFPVLIKTKIPTKKKVVLLGLFAIGFFITVIQIIRIQYMKSLVEPLNSGTVILWSTVETNLGVIVACVPVLSPLFRQKQNVPSEGARGLSWRTSPASNTTRRYKIEKQLNPSIDSLCEPEMNDTHDIASRNSREPILGRSRIVREEDIVVTNQLAPAHLAPLTYAQLARARMGNYEYWAGGTNMADNNGALCRYTSQV